MKKSLRQRITSIYRLLRPVIDPRSFLAGVAGYPGFLLKLRRYSRMPNAEPAAQRSLYPILGENTDRTGFAADYLYMGDWAFRKVIANPAPSHLDVGAQLHWVVSVAAIKPITFLDVRPADLHIANLTVKRGSILELPFRDREMASVSCLHVIEHIGLGRYGDPLNPEGTRQAARELARVLAPGGTLLVALPIGAQHLYFNAHRVHRPSQVINWFAVEGLKLKSFAAVDADGVYHPAAHAADYEERRSGCGLFEFER